MPDRAARAGLRAAAASTAAVVFVLLCAAPSWCAAGDRATTEHVLIGLTPNAGFEVSVNGQPLEGGPVVTSELGIASFGVDEGAFSEGTRYVVIGDPGDLMISNVFVDGVTAAGATVHWTTNLPSNSGVTYGPTTDYGSEAGPDPALAMTHVVALSGLTPGTTYHYMVTSDDGQGHAASSGDGVFATSQVPLAIENVSVDSVGQMWAAVSWTTNRPSNSVVEYGLTAEYGDSTEVDPALVETHSVVVDGLSPGTVYHMRVRSSDGGIPPAVSGDAEFSTALAPLSLTGVEVAETGDTWAVIRWTTDRAADSRVEYGLSIQYGDSSATDPRLVTAHEITLSDLEPGVGYHFRAWSDDGSAAPAASDDQEFSTIVNELEMSGLTVGPIGQTWAVVSWSTNRPAATYVAYGESDAYGQFASPGDGFATEHSATLAGLAQGTLYHFRAVSFDQDLQSVSSPDSTLVTMQGDVTGPPQMEGVDLDAVSATSVVVTWTTDRPATSQVVYGTDGVFDCETRADTTLVTEHSVIVWPVVPRLEYSFVALSACGCDTTSCSPLVFSTSPPAAASLTVKPLDLIKIIVTPNDDSSALIIWASDRPCSTWVDYGEAQDYGESAPGMPLGNAAYQAELPDLEPGARYHIRVSGWDAPGGEVTGEDILFEMVEPPDHQAPARPTGVACSLSEAGVEVRWDSNTESDLAGYNVYRARSRPGWIDWSRAVMLNSTPVTESRYVDSSIEQGAAYAYAVTAVDGSDNESLWSENATIETSPVEPGLFRLAAYPNPVRDDANFAFALPAGVSSARLRVLSLSGRVVMDTEVAYRSSGEQSLTWDARDPSGWPVGDGVYLCELRAGGSVARTKLTVLR